MRARIVALLTLVLLLCSCGGTAATTAPSTRERTSIAQAIRSSFASTGIKIVGMRLSHSDPHFAGVLVTKKNLQGQQLDVVVVVLVQMGGKWTVVLGPGTAFPQECTQPTPRPIRELLCHNPFSVLRKEG